MGSHSISAEPRYYAKVQADRQARNDRFKAEKAKEDTVRRDEEITRLRDEAKMAAFGGEIEDCNILIGWFKGKYGGGEVPSTNAGDKLATAQLQGVKEIEVRKVENDFAGMTLKKKGEDEELGGFFASKGKGKKKGKKGSGAATPVEGGGKEVAVNLPMSLLSALLALGISPPTGKEDVQRTLDDLDTKKAWFEANSATKTKVSHTTAHDLRILRPRLSVWKSSSPRCRRRLRRLKESTGTTPATRW